MKKFALLFALSFLLFTSVNAQETAGGSATLSAGPESSLFEKINGNRYKIVKAIKNNKPVNYKATDYLQFSQGNVLEEVLQGLYIKGTWTVSGDTIVINEQSTGKWKVSEQSVGTLNASKGTERIVLEKIETPPATSSSGSLKYNQMCGKWAPTEHKNGSGKVNDGPTDFTMFYGDGTYEQVLMGIYIKGSWAFNADETVLTLGNTAWTVKEMNGVVFKAIKGREVITMTKI